MSYIIKKGFELSDSKELVYSVSAILIGVSLAFKNNAAVNSFTKIFFRNYTVILVFGISLVIVILACFKKRRIKK